jgi:hypothetical protein
MEQEEREQTHPTLDLLATGARALCNIQLILKPVDAKTWIYIHLLCYVYWFKVELTRV